MVAEFLADTRSGRTSAQIVLATAIMELTASTEDPGV